MMKTYFSSWVSMSQTNVPKQTLNEIKSLTKEGPVPFTTQPPSRALPNTWHLPWKQQNKSCNLLIYSNTELYPL